MRKTAVSLAAAATTARPAYGERGERYKGRARAHYTRSQFSRLLQGSNAGGAQEDEETVLTERAINYMLDQATRSL